MLKVVIGLFGFSAFLFLPFFWRLGRAVFSALRPRGTRAGGGVVRLCITMVLSVVAASTFEAGIRGAGAGSVGEGALAYLSTRMGTASAVAAAFGLLVLVLPWYLGWGWRGVFRAVAALARSLGFGGAGGGDDAPAEEDPRRGAERDWDSGSSSALKPVPKWLMADRGATSSSAASSVASSSNGLPPTSSLSSLTTGSAPVAQPVRSSMAPRGVGTTRASTLSSASSGGLSPRTPRAPRASSVPEGAYDWRRAAEQTAREREAASAKPLTRGPKPWVPAPRSRTPQPPEPVVIVPQTTHGFPGARPVAQPPARASTGLTGLSGSAAPSAAQTGASTGMSTGMSTRPAARSPLRPSGNGMTANTTSATPLHTEMGTGTPAPVSPAPSIAVPPSAQAKANVMRRPIEGGVPHTAQERKEPTWKASIPAREHDNDHAPASSGADHAAYVPWTPPLPTMPVAGASRPVVDPQVTPQQTMPSQPSQPFASATVPTSTPQAAAPRAIPTQTVAPLAPASAPQVLASAEPAYVAPSPASSDAAPAIPAAPAAPAAAVVHAPRAVARPAPWEDDLDVVPPIARPRMVSTDASDLDTTDHIADATVSAVGNTWSTRPSDAAIVTPTPITSVTPAAPSTWAERVTAPVTATIPAPATASAPTPAIADSVATLSATPTAPPRGAPTDAFSSLLPEAPAVELPGLELLAPPSDVVEQVSPESLQETGQLIEQRLREFKVPVSVVGASAGPVITRFEVEPAVGVRGSQIVGLMKDLARGLGMTSIRVVETIPGKTCMGLELPNPQRQMIRLSEILAADAYRHHDSPLAIAMGKDITGEPVVIDLARAPHMLVAGTTGSGKSVAVNAMILSLLYRATPETLRMIMIDPKMLELSVYEGIPHLLAPVVTDMRLAGNALNWCVAEMEKRYRLMSALGVRNLAGYNQKIRAGIAAERRLTNPFSLTPDAPEPLSPLPMIVVIIDELADLMMVAGKKVEELIARLAQKARASGIHLVLATQRPSVDVITGLIKANIPTRVAFQVSSKIDSRTILDQMGAESLLGQGDMLFLPPGSGDPQRVHGAFVADDEVHRVVEHLKQFGEPNYEESILAGSTVDGIGGDGGNAESGDAEADPLYDEAVAFVVRSRRASISSVQRQFRIGYNRAARLVEQMEASGVVSAMGNNGGRDVLAPGPAD